MNDLESAHDEEREARFVKRYRERFEVPRQIAQPLDIVAESGAQALVVRVSALRLVADARDEIGGEKKRGRVDDEGRIDAPSAGHEAARRRAHCEHDRPRCPGDGIRGAELSRGH